MRAFIVACLLATALAQTYMAPVHMVEPVYDNSKPSQPQADPFPCGAGCNGEPRPAIGTNVVIDDDVTAPPQWNSSSVSSKFVTFDSLDSNANAPKSKNHISVSSVHGKTGRRKLVWKLGNATVRIAGEVKVLRQSIRAIALRVDAHRAHITALLNNASAAESALTTTVAKLNRTISTARKMKKLKRAQAARFFEATARLTKRLERARKAIAFIRAIPKDKTPLPANAPAAIAFAQAKAGVPIKQATAVLSTASANVASPSVSGSNATLAKSVRGVTKKAVLKAETIDIARQIDEVMNLTLSTARNVDKNKTGVTRLVEVIRGRVTSLRVLIRKEIKRVNASAAKGLITQVRQQKEMRAMRLLAGKLRKIGRALGVIVKDNQKLKIRRVVQTRGNATEAKLRRKVVRLAASVDRARKQLARLKTLSPKNPRFMELVGVEEQKLITQAKKIDKFLRKIQALKRSNAVPAVRADRLIRAVSLMRNHIKNLALAVAAQKKRRV